MTDAHAHICSTRVSRSTEEVIAFLSAAEKLPLWAVGLGETRLHAGGLIEGTFPDSGLPIWARIDPDPVRGTIHYYLGNRPDDLVPRIMICVVPPRVLRSSDSSCVVSMVAWRQDDMDDLRWRSLCYGHESEIIEIRRLIEEEGRTPDNRDTIPSS